MLGTACAKASGSGAGCVCSTNSTNMKERTAAGDLLAGMTASFYMSKLLETALLIAGAVVLLAPTMAAQASRNGPTMSTMDSVYTVEQARRGHAVMTKVCADCHIQNWFTGTFLASWAGARVSYLYEVISTTMPEDRPGALTSQEYVDIIAYIFELNGLPAGRRELPHRKETLAAILIKQLRR